MDSSRNTISPKIVSVSSCTVIHPGTPSHHTLSLSVPAKDRPRETILKQTEFVSPSRRIHPRIHFHNKLSLTLSAAGSIQGHHFTTKCLCLFLQGVIQGTPFYHKLSLSLTVMDCLCPSLRWINQGTPFNYKLY